MDAQGPRARAHAAVSDAVGGEIQRRGRLLRIAHVDEDHRVRAVLVLARRVELPQVRAGIATIEPIMNVSIGTRHPPRGARARCRVNLIQLGLRTATGSNRPSSSPGSRS